MSRLVDQVGNILFSKNLPTSIYQRGKVGELILYMFSSVIVTPIYDSPLISIMSKRPILISSYDCKGFFISMYPIPHLLSSPKVLKASSLVNQETTSVSYLLLLCVTPPLNSSFWHVLYCRWSDPWSSKVIYLTFILSRPCKQTLVGYLAGCNHVHGYSYSCFHVMIDFSGIFKNHWSETFFKVHENTMQLWHHTLTRVLIEYWTTLGVPVELNLCHNLLWLLIIFTLVLIRYWFHLYRTDASCRPLISFVKVILKRHLTFWIWFGNIVGIVPIRRVISVTIVVLFY